MRPLAVLAVLVAAALPTSASAFVVHPVGALESAANGITLGPDGNFWAVEAGAGKVVRMKPDGSVLGRFPVGASPTSIASGPGGRVWVAVTGADKLVWIDATSASPTTHDVPTSDFSDCGPVAIEAGNNGRMYFSLPQDACSSDSKVGYVKDDGSGGMAAANNRGKAYDLQVAGGKLFIPDFEGASVRRTALDDALTIETTVATSAGNPDGITADSGGRIWVTLYGNHKVARFPATQAGGEAIESAPADGALEHPFGIAAGADGFIYVAGSASENLVRIDPDTGQSVAYAMPSGSSPWQIVNGPDEDIWMTDLAGARLLRFVNGKPRARNFGAAPAASTAGSATAEVEPRGNATSVVFDYGTTTAYGSTTAPSNIAADAGATAVSAVLSGLAPSTTYHVRMRATNAEGTTTSEDRTFTTPSGVVDGDGDGVSPPLDCDDANPAIRPGATDIPGDDVDQDCAGGDAAYPRLTANPSFAWTNRPSFTLLRKVRAARLVGGETARITCRGRGCPFRSRTFRNLKAGERSFDRLFRRKRLRPKTVVQMRITKPGTIGAVTTLTMRRGKDPKVVHTCLTPGVTRPHKC